MNPAIDFSRRHISFEEYLVREENEDERHEYIDGEVVAMAGATDNHELVAGLLFADIQNHLRGKGCRVYKGDMKLRFRAGEVDLGYYPDIMVVCDPADSHPTVKTRPKLLVEVMSSFKQDHFEKLFVYQQIASLEAYLVVDQDPGRPRAWLYRRENGWKMPPALTGGEIRLQSIDLTLVLENLYRA
jgi:Uma2 family endonuclease